MDLTKDQTELLDIEKEISELKSVIELMKGWWFFWSLKLSIRKNFNSQFIKPKDYTTISEKTQFQDGYNDGIYLFW